MKIDPFSMIWTRCRTLGTAYLKYCLTVLYTVKTRVEVGAAGVHTEDNCEGGQHGVSAAHPRSTS